MQKTYWWRVSLIIACLVVIFGSYVGTCQFSFGKCIGGDSIPFTRMFFHITLSALIVSPTLFFIRDAVFLAWLRFAIAWFVITVILIALAPVSTGGWMSFGPTKELVSIWMGGLFVIVSLAKLAWDSKKAR